MNYMNEDQFHRPQLHDLQLEHLDTQILECYMTIPILG
jgi:hypothetical protein